MRENREPTEAEALRRQVEARAYALWESEGKPQGRDLDHWLQAEAEIMGARETASSVNLPNPTASLQAARRKPRVHPTELRSSAAPIKPTHCCMHSLVRWQDSEP